MRLHGQGEEQLKLRRALWLCTALAAFGCGDSDPTEELPRSDAGPRDAGATGTGGGEDDHDDDDSIVTRRASRVTSAPTTFTVINERYRYRPTGNGAGLSSFELTQKPSGMEMRRGQLEWTPTAEQAGSHRVVVRGVDGDEAFEQEFRLSVASATMKADGEVASTGGSVAVDDGDLRGAGVSVPLGALSGPARLTVSQLSASPTLPNMVGRARVVHYGPNGTAFAQPATVMLPLPEHNGALSMANLAAFVWNTEGRWQRVQVLSIDPDNHVMLARARHFSIYVAAQSTLTLETSLARADSSSTCAGALIATADVTSGLEKATLASVNNLPDALSGPTPDATSILQLLTPTFEGSLRVVQVFELVEPYDGAELPREQRLIATTVHFPGDGTATLTHADALGNVLAQKRFTALTSALAELQQRLSGAATVARFRVTPSPQLAIAARVHLLYFAGDASLDPVSIDDLGVAASERAPVGYDAAASAADDVDCDGVLDAFDPIDDSLLLRIEAEPSGTIRLLPGERATLRADLQNGQNATTTWTAIGPQGEDASLLGALAEQPSVRTFESQQPGRYVVSFRAGSATQRVENNFAIEVLEPASGAENEPPTCVPSKSVAAARSGETIGLAATVSDEESPASKLRIEWGLVTGEGAGAMLTASPTLSSTGELAAFTPTFDATYVVGCRAYDGQQFGAIGRLPVTVVPPGQNRAPAELTLTPAVADIATGATLGLQAFARDPDGDALAFSWDVHGDLALEEDPTPQANASRVRVRATYRTGKGTITVLVGDGKAQAVLTTELTVLPPPSGSSGDAGASNLDAGSVTSDAGVDGGSTKFDGGVGTMVDAGQPDAGAQGPAGDAGTVVIPVLDAGA